MGEIVKKDKENKGTSVLPDWVGKVALLLRIVAKVSPNLAAKFMATMWFKPFMPEQKQYVIDWQNTADEELVLQRGQAFLFSGVFSESDQKVSQDTHLDESKPLVVCVHGWRGRAHQMRRFVPELLARGFRVVMVNLPAHTGRVESGVGKNHTHIYECAAALKEINAKIGSIDSVIAHSFGAPTTALALDGDFKLRKLVMVAANLDINYLLNEYAIAFDLQYLTPRIEQHIKKYCDKHIFSGAWESLTTELIIANLINAKEVDFWHDPEDTEINVAINEVVHKQLKQRQQTSHIHEVPSVGHFDILKDSTAIQRVCDSLKST